MWPAYAPFVQTHFMPPSLMREWTAALAQRSGVETVSDATTVQILLHLEPAERLRALGTWRRWASLRRVSEMWPQIALRAGTGITEAVLERLPRVANFGSVRRLTLEDNKNAIRTETWRAALCAIHENQLTSLRVSGKVFKVSLFRLLGKRFGASLDELALGTLKDLSFALELLKLAPNLRSLTLPSSHESPQFLAQVGGCLGANCRLERLTVTPGVAAVTHLGKTAYDAPAVLLKASFPNLVALRVADFGVLRSSLAPGWTSLRSLALGFDGGQPPSDLYFAARSLRTACPNLDDLHVSFSRRDADNHYVAGLLQALRDVPLSMLALGHLKVKQDSFVLALGTWIAQVPPTVRALAFNFLYEPKSAHLLPGLVADLISARCGSLSFASPACRPPTVTVGLEERDPHESANGGPRFFMLASELDVDALDVRLALSWRLPV